MSKHKHHIIPRYKCEELGIDPDFDDNFVEVINNLLEIGEIHKHIVNSLDNTYMITKRTSRIIFAKLRTIIYKYRGFE